MKLIAEYNDLKAIADSIREKTSTADEMNIYEMPALIEGIKIGEDLENELTTQDNLITQIQAALEGKANLELPPLTNPATADKVLNGYEYVNTDGTKSVGTMANNGAVSQTIAANGSYTIPAGYHNGSGKVTQSLTTKGATTYGAKTSAQTIAAGQYLSGAQTIAAVTQTNLTAANIVKGKTVTIKSNGSNLWSITGTYDASSNITKIFSTEANGTAYTYTSTVAGSVLAIFTFANSDNDASSITCTASAGTVTELSKHYKVNGWSAGDYTNAMIGIYLIKNITVGATITFTGTYEEEDSPIYLVDIIQIT